LREAEGLRELPVDSVRANDFGLGIEILAWPAANHFGANVVQGVRIVHDGARLLAVDSPLPPSNASALAIGTTGQHGHGRAAVNHSHCQLA